MNVSYHNFIYKWTYIPVEMKQHFLWGRELFQIKLPSQYFFYCS